MVLCLSHGNEIRWLALAQSGDACRPSDWSVSLCMKVRHCMQWGVKPPTVPSTFLRSSYDCGGSSWERSSSTVGIVCGFLVGVMTAVSSLSSESSSSLPAYLWAPSDAKGLNTPYTDKKHPSGTLAAPAQEEPLLQAPRPTYATAGLLQDPVVAAPMRPN